MALIIMKSLHKWERCDFHRYYFYLFLQLLPEILVLSTVAKASTVTNYPNSFQKTLQSFITNLILRKHGDCELVNIFPPNFESHKYLSEEFNSSGNYNLEIFQNVTYRQAKLEDVRRYNSANCALAIIFIPDNFDDDELPKWLFNTTTSPYAPLIRKDYDHFIFVCSETRNCDKILMSSQYGNKIKFKIALSESSSARGEMVIKAVDLFGNGGMPVLLPLSSESLNLFPDTTKTFHGKNFLCSNPRSHTYYDVERLPNGKYRGLRGLYKTWLDTVKDRLNFSVEVYESSLSGGSGKLLPNGTWGGTVGDVMYGAADIGAFVGHTFARHEVIGYSATITYEWMFFINHKPRHYYTSTAVFKPLSFILWVGFFVSLIFMGMTFKRILRSKWTLYSYINYVFASFMEQDADVYMDITGNASRVLVTFWLFYALVFSTAYRGKLVGLIAFPMSTWVPSTYDDLAYHDYRVGLHRIGKGGAADSIFASSSNRVFQILNSRIEFFTEPTLCMKEALSKNIACLLWKCHYEYGLYDSFTDKNGQSPFQSSIQSSYFLHDEYIWERNAVFGKTIDKLGWPLLENGIVDFWLATDHKIVMDLRFERERELEKNGTKPLDLSPYFDGDDGPTKLILVQFKGVFILFFCGILAGSLCFIGEYWKYKRYSKRGDHSIIVTHKRFMYFFHIA